MTEPAVNIDDAETLLSLSEIHAHLQRSLGTGYLVNNLTKIFRALNSNEERINFTYDILKEHSLLPKLLTIGKCDQKSEERRKYGNHVFIAQKRDYNAMIHYNKSIAFAKNKGALALGYGNRSAVFYRNKLYKECIKDIKYAFENGYPENLTEKLKQRRKMAEEHIAEQFEVDEYFTATPSVSGPVNPRIQCASNRLKIENTESMGRHVVATEYINPGEVMAIEKPYINILLYDHYLTHCYHCLRPSFNLIPCHGCSLTMFCGNECRKTAWTSYHQYECDILDTLHGIEVTKMHLLSLRVLLCARKQLMKCFGGNKYDADGKLIEKTNENDDGGDDDDDDKENRMYKSDSYTEIHQLITNEEQRAVNDLFSRAVVAAIITNLLEKFTSFFSEFTGEYDTEQIRNATTTMLFRHFQTAPSNMHEITEFQGSTGTDYEMVDIGSGAYSFNSLLNHSCAPNVVRHFHGTTLVLCALRPIKPGDQLFDNYGYHHALMQLEQRHEHLREQYLFCCECEACKNDWPLYHELDRADSRFLISPSEFTALQKGSRDMAQKLLPNLLANAVEFESLPYPTIEILDNQEILKQCFAVLGNKYTKF